MLQIFFLDYSAQSLNPSISNNSFSLVMDLISALSIFPNTAFVIDILDNSSITLTYSNLLSLLTKFDINNI